MATAILHTRRDQADVTGQLSDYLRAVEDQGELLAPISARVSTGEPDEVPFTPGPGSGPVVAEEDCFVVLADDDGEGGARTMTLYMNGAHIARGHLGRPVLPAPRDACGAFVPVEPPKPGLRGR